MGCCISFNKKTPHQPKPHAMREIDSNNKANKAPPPPCLEEETVKEVVLSETPLPRAQQIPKENATQTAIIQERNNVEAKDLNLTINKHEQEEEEEEMSQVSEIYSISESFSTTTTTATTTTVALTEIKEDEATSKATSRQLNYRSPAKVPRKRPNAGEISRGAKSPAKRADSSSRVMSRPVPGRTLPSNVGPSGAKRESGGGFSRRQMRSPATETAGGVRRRSPGKVTTDRSGGKLRVENDGKEEEEVNDSVLVEKSELNESLDNPHVSLECFIFL